MLRYRKVIMLFVFLWRELGINQRFLNTHRIWEHHNFLSRTDTLPGTGVLLIYTNNTRTPGSNYSQTRGTPYGCFCRMVALILPMVNILFRKPWRWRGHCKNFRCQTRSNTPDALSIDWTKNSFRGEEDDIHARYHIKVFPWNEVSLSHWFKHDTWLPNISLCP